ncbi:sigma-70 family RNA polymerase sigma factor [Microbacterium sp. Leaf320]|uniref:sigma-70 family RNA polymerase sigma factor n=1 Tax=Microbacterium sp. Leaf320 TaxID=1736334 RepID=UPI0009EB6B97
MLVRPAGATTPAYCWLAPCPLWVETVIDHEAGLGQATAIRRNPTAENRTSSSETKRKREHFRQVERFYAENRDQLARVARWLVYGTRVHVDHEDLVSEAILRCLDSCADAVSPAGMRSYLVASMRNRIIDESRAPRSYNVAWSPALDNQHSAPAPYLPAEMNEQALVSRALARISGLHRRYLLRTVVDGSKPRELIEEFGRAAPALSSLAQRARRSLSEALLDVLAEQCASSGHGQTRLVKCGRCLEVWMDLALAYGSRAAAEREIRRWCETRLTNASRVADGALVLLAPDSPAQHRATTQTLDS